jgi:hypothetical protein
LLLVSTTDDRDEEEEEEEKVFETSSPKTDTSSSSSFKHTHQNHQNQYKSIADDRVREIAKLEKQIVSLEALMDPRTNKDGIDALKIKLAECEGTIAALRLEIASVRGKLDKKSKAASSSDDDISSSKALSKLAQLAGSAAGSAGFGSGFNSRDYLLGVVSGMALLGVLVSVNHHRSGGTVSLRWFGETVSALLKTSTTSSAK